MSRATEGFSASTATLPDSADTIVLLQCNGSTKFRLSADEVQGFAGSFVGRRPVRGRGGSGWGARDGDGGGLTDRSQLGGGSGVGAFGGGVAGCSGGVHGLRAGAAEFGIGAVPGAFEGGDLSLHADEEFGGGGLGKEYGGEGVAGWFGEDRVEEIGLDAPQAALLPIGAEHGIDVEGFGGGLGTELAVVVGGKGVVIGGIFAGDDDGGGVQSVLQGVEAGDGLALDGAGSGGLLRVGAIGGDLSGGSHDYDLARGWRGIWGWRR